MFRRDFFSSVFGTSIFSLFGVKPKEEMPVIDMRINECYCLINERGDIEYYKKGNLHRDGDQPAAIDVDGTQYYYKDGNLHRDGDKPALI